MKSLAPVVAAVLVLVSACTAQKAATYEEIKALLQPLTDGQLIDCLKEKPTNCPLAVSYRDMTVIDDELADRKHPDLLIAACRKGDPHQRHHLLLSLRQIDDPEVVTFMQSMAFADLLDQETDEAFIALDYLAQRCDPRVLARLNRRVPLGPRAAIECASWAPIVRAFGRCSYRAAAPNLVRALRAPCQNINNAAEESLQSLFPGACSQTKSIDEEAGCYEKQLGSQSN